MIPSTSEKYWDAFREGVVGEGMEFVNEHGIHRVLYADWIASGRLYAPIEIYMLHEVGPHVSNPHSYSSHIGKWITQAYKEAREQIKTHVNANDQDMLIVAGGGMTAGLVRLQEVMGLKKKTKDRPVVFISHMEHHSNHVSWLECEVDVVIVPPDASGLISLDNLRTLLKKYADRTLKIAAFTACSNVTGLITPVAALAACMHQHGGYLFVDYAASAPYVTIDMHPNNDDERLDAVFFSPHKFLGGPGSAGVSVFRADLHISGPSLPGGGNVKMTSPANSYLFDSNKESWEDGGTPMYLQTIRASQAILLKEEMGVANIQAREKILIDYAIQELSAIDEVTLLGQPFDYPGIGAIAFNIEGLHYNLVVTLLNDRFGIQVRGGWSCASTYAHYLCEVDDEASAKLRKGISEQNMSGKPGWIRLSLHPTMRDSELAFCVSAIREIIKNAEEWKQDFTYNPQTNEFDKKTTYEKIME